MVTDSTVAMLLMKNIDGKISTCSLHAFAMVHLYRRCQINKHEAITKPNITSEQLKNFQIDHSTIRWSRLFIVMFALLLLKVVIAARLQLKFMIHCTEKQSLQKNIMCSLLFIQTLFFRLYKLCSAFSFDAYLSGIFLSVKLKLFVCWSHLHTE